MKKILVLAALAICLLACEVQASGRRAVVVRGRRAVIVQRPFVQRQFFRQRQFFGGYGHASAFVAPVAVQSFYAAPLAVPVVADYSLPVVQQVLVQPVVIRQRAFFSGFGYSHGFGRSAIIIRRR